MEHVCDARSNMNKTATSGSEYCRSPPYHEYVARHQRATTPMNGSEWVVSGDPWGGRKSGRQAPPLGRVADPSS